MSRIGSEIGKWLRERRADLQDTHLKLIEDDAPKVKLSVLTGRILELKNIEGELLLIEKKVEDSERE